MIELLEANLLVVLLALLVVLAAVWWLLLATRRTRVEPGDQDPGIARRNQALIDAPAAAPTGAAPTRAAQAPEIGTDPGSEDLARIKGLGPKLAGLLAENGVISLAQIAAWDDSEIDRIDALLGRFEGRIRRDNWVDQAKLLVSGDLVAYQARFGRIE